MEQNQWKRGITCANLQIQMDQSTALMSINAEQRKDAEWAGIGMESDGKKLASHQTPIQDARENSKIT